MADNTILSLNAFDSAHTSGLREGVRERVQQRGHLFGAASVLFYDEPLEFVRGEGCWLHAADGEMYLDAYNNVPSVGHCHPRVVEAMTRQLRELNLNTRYLNARVADYAANLLATFAPPLTNITLTCTGSESNDLALRLAKNYTGGNGVIVSAAAYHGNTDLTTQVSPSSFKQGAPPKWVAVIPPPDVRRVAAGGVAGPGGLAGRAELGALVAADVARALANFRAQGIRPAALLVDSIFSSDGVFADPPGFLREAVKLVHDAGALFIADEVQPGFGRTGAGLWGFERHGVVPDIVTLGKPMGNGYPMGAVITRPEILSEFCARVGYFNTFGGSAVAAAAGQAVLQVLAEERLVANAATVGGYLRSGLESRAGVGRALRAVRGAGLYLGVDVESATTTRLILNGMRDRKVLIGAAGSAGSALKIRPPLCFSVPQADQLLAALDDTLAAIGGASEGVSDGAIEGARGGR
jgi:4-aminobutyrate aminotransferase-like enzyme